MWDPGQYQLFREERRRPFFDLLARVPVAAPAVVADLGCGAGDLSRVLAERWPAAQVVGVDASAAMLAAGTDRAAPDNLRFEVADLTVWEAPAPVDLLVSNAALHWVPGHHALLARLVGLLAPGGVLAFQVPAQAGEPSHRRVAEVSSEPRFAAALVGVRRGRVESLAFYEERLAELGLKTDAWDTAYLHLLPGEDAVLQWLLGTTLRPLLAVLGDADGSALVDALRPLLRQDYPAYPRGTPFLFRRRFVVAVRDRRSR